ncbi:hypothetical protein VT84_26085 [Gemmata sp. SH-PL17]|uniref:hypothetical protein n=1 Tax=Gemmata sp. SH-PL17 TaxID=1630693 RepID=UPI0004B06C4F|nr:hypothetical protein [Gemmata sp. SH-PL17]AMV27900.1 hypothetical protein VT84_26085 [Gemmata sp. SH-PL17]
MNFYELLIPQLLAGAVIIVIALRAVHQSRLESEAHEQRIAKKHVVHEQYAAQVQEALAHPELPASTFITEWARLPVLRVTLDLADPNALADVGRMAQDAGPLITGLSDYEVKIGGRGLTFTEMKVAPGQVILTLTPKNAAGATERVARVADALNATFGAITPIHEPALNLGSLPGDVAGARAAALAA